ncbi:MAG: RidA family protein [Bacteroidia bacterium]|nr:RidA family protein [Bacteroidia bacterium]MDW8417365.1 RidA family protein [Bacteroidia bacterium]
MRLGMLVAVIYGQISPEKGYNRGMQYITPSGLTPVGPYSPAVRVGPWLFISGQIALRPDSTLEKSSIAAETEQVLHNLRSVLEAASASPEKIVKVTIFLTDMAFFPTVNSIYERFFPSGKYPARETVAVSALPRGARIEISAIAYLGE